MMTVHEVSRLTGVSIRALQYYDRIGLLHPNERSEAGYRLYNDSALENLQQILLFRELEFSLDEIQRIINRPDFDREKALEQQIQILEMKRERIGELIQLAERIRTGGNKNMGFEAFDTKKLHEYEEKAKAYWGDTPAFHEYERKAEHRTDSESEDVASQMMEIFSEFGKIRNGDPASETAQNLVEKLKRFITEHYYTCTDEILSGLGKMYAGGGEMTENIDRQGGKGTGDFAERAIRIYCGK